MGQSLRIPRAVTAVVGALVVLAFGMAASTSAARAATSRATHGGEVRAGQAAAGSIVIDGDARFEVLTPTLIRLEYAGDGQFQDEATFNAVNRSFPPVSYTTDVSGGYREITTSALTLRYQEGSGPFTPANTSISVDGTNVIAAPTFPSYCTLGSVCEAENALLGWGAATSYDHTGYTGSGFVSGFSQTGSALSQDVSAIPSAGTYQLTVRYANATGGDGQTTTRTLSTTIDGAPGPKLSMPATSSWDTWSTISVPVTLRDSWAAAARGTACMGRPAGSGQRWLRCSPSVASPMSCGAARAVGPGGLASASSAPRALPLLGRLPLSRGLCRWRATHRLVTAGFR